MRFAILDVLISAIFICVANAAYFQFQADSTTKAYQLIALFVIYVTSGTYGVFKLLVFYVRIRYRIKYESWIDQF